MSEVRKPTEEELRRDLLHYCQKVYQQGWVANHDGNLSARLTNGHFLCTPTAMSKGDITAEMLLVIDKERKVLSGSRRIFSEFQLHEAAYAARPDIGCVIHSHPPTASGFAVANVPLGPPFMAEAIVSLGPTIPLIPFFPPKDPRLSVEIEKGFQQSDVLMLANHGLLSVGGSFEQAFLRMELVEHLCKILLVAKQMGGAKPLSSEVVEKLSKRGRPPSVPNYSPDWKANTTKGVVATASPKPDLGKIVSDALQRYQ